MEPAPGVGREHRGLLVAGPNAALVPPPSSTAAGLTTRTTSDAVAAAAEAADHATRRPSDDAPAEALDTSELAQARRANALRRLLGSMRT